jgi:hypothetical protein
MTVHVARARGLLVAAVIVAIAACTTAGPRPTGLSPSATGGSPPVDSPVVVPTPAGTPVATVAVGAQPPTALLAPADRTSPRVVGQLGGYTWRGVGSDAPWLPGSPLAVRAGAPLTLVLEPGLPIESWHALVTMQDDRLGEHATAAGEGTGTVGLAGLPPGRWILAIQVVFEGGAGDAAYYWRIEAD